MSADIVERIKRNLQVAYRNTSESFVARATVVDIGNDVDALADEIERLRAERDEAVGFIRDVEPFIGYQASVPHLLERAEAILARHKGGRDDDE